MRYGSIQEPKCRQDEDKMRCAAFAVRLFSHVLNQDVSSEAMYIWKILSVFDIRKIDHYLDLHQVIDAQA